jgi:hypothetical protein
MASVPPPLPEGITQSIINSCLIPRMQIHSTFIKDNTKTAAYYSGFFLVSS